MIIDDWHGGARAAVHAFRRRLAKGPVLVSPRSWCYVRRTEGRWRPAPRAAPCARKARTVTVLPHVLAEGRGEPGR